jgi:hypothetical protein
VIYLQEKVSQGLNQQEEGVSLHNKCSPWYQALLIHYTYVILETRDYIYKMVYQRGQNIEPNQSFHLYLLSPGVHHFKTRRKSGLLCSITHIYAMVILLSKYIAGVVAWWASFAGGICCNVNYHFWICFWALWSTIPTSRRLSPSCMTCPTAVERVMHAHHA